MSTERYWASLTTREFESLDLERTIAVLPLGAIEQHGPHLPVSVDTDIVNAVVERVVPSLGELSVLFLPTMTIGKSNEHIAFPGTLTFSAETLLRMWMEVGSSVARAGVRKLVFLNSHGGNVAAMDIVARDLRAEHGMLTASCSWFNLYQGDELFDSRELVHGIHGGQSETSIMLAIREHLVDMTLAENFHSVSEQWSKHHEYLGVGSSAVKVGWLIQDLNLKGACGNAAGATAKLGERLLALGASNFAAFLREFDGLPLKNLDAYPR